jgi:hypothetical protein
VLVVPVTADDEINGYCRQHSGPGWMVRDPERRYWRHGIAHETLTEALAA